jgi:hypothetical protein
MNTLFSDKDYQLKRSFKLKLKGELFFLFIYYNYE